MNNDLGFGAKYFTIWARPK